MPQIFALLIGIDAYAPGSNAPTLRGCVADAHALSARLIRQFGIPEGHVRVLTNEQATVDAVVTSWRSFLRDRVTPGDTAFLHFSGHGSQVLSADPAEVDGLDETLVLWDSRLPGRSDLRDKEVAALIAEVQARGAQMILFLDCCHAGGATRADEAGAVRACPRDVRRAPAATLGAPAAPGRAATRGDEARRAKATARSDEPKQSPTVALAACLDEEVARETLDQTSVNRPGQAHVAGQDSSAAQWHGAATWAFLRALDEATPSTTWDILHVRVVAGVRSLHLRQTPQLRGAGSTLLWGGSGQVAEFALIVLRVVDGGSVLIDGGAAIGLGEGGRIAIEQEAGAGATLAATVVSAGVDSAWAQLETPAIVAVGSRARILSYGYGSPVHPVRVEDADVIAALQASQARFVRRAAIAAAPFAVVVDEEHYRIVDGTGQPLVADEPPRTPAGAREVVRLLEHMAIFRNVRSLRNRAADPSLAQRIEVGPASIVRSSRGSLAEVGLSIPLREQGGLPAAASGQPIGFAVTNRSAQRLFVTVLRLGPEMAIRRIEPIDERQTTLPAGRRLFVRDRVPPAGRLPDDTLLVYKVLATTIPVSFDALLLGPIGQVDPLRSTEVRDAGPLSALLDGLRRTGTRPAAAAIDEAMWLTKDVVVAIE